MTVEMLFELMPLHARDTHQCKGAFLVFFADYHGNAIVDSIIESCPSGEKMQVLPYEIEFDAERRPILHLFEELCDLALHRGFLLELIFLI